LIVGKKRVLIVAALVAVGVIAIGGVASAGTMLEATLTGEAEVDNAGNPNQGDLNGTGEATLNLMPSQQRICYTITVSRIKPATMAHIHEAPAGQNGPIVKALKAPSDGSSRGCVRLDRAKILEIRNNPSDFYVNVHNRPFPNGALRGQLSPAGP
jgi:hypothetical protein